MCLRGGPHTCGGIAFEVIHQSNQLLFCLVLRLACLQWPPIKCHGLFAHTCTTAGVIAGYEPDFSQPPPKPRRQNLILAALQESRVEEAGFKQAIALIYRRVSTLLFAAINRIVHI